MKTVIFIQLILVALCTISCNGAHLRDRTKYSDSEKIDSLLDNGANPYDVASYLYENPDYLYVPIESTDESPYEVKTSPDGKFRVYSIFVSQNYTSDIHNIFQYQIDEQDPIFLKADAGDIGSITNIGMLKKGDKTYYLLLSEFYVFHQSVLVSNMISVYSVDDNIYDSLKREALFKTKNGNKLETIEVVWENIHGEKDSDKLFGISIDNPNNTREIYIQIIDQTTGHALDKAIVYRWDGNNYTYCGTKLM